MDQSAVQKFLRSELSFYLTIIGAVMAFAGMYFGLSNRIDLLAQDLKYLNQTISANDSRVAALEIRITNNEKEILKLQK